MPMPTRIDSWEFSAELSSPEQARHHTADALMAWGVDQFASDAVLIVSELVTNAVTHAMAPPRLELRYDGSTLWIGVHDNGPGTPEIAEWNRDATGGLGLRVVGGLARRWYVEPDDTGKTIWCELGSGQNGILKPARPG
jgi:anti-sigma regulatory factor (Ser/Thr protein kinase)